MNLLAQLKKGTTVLALLSALERGEVYGYGIRRDAYRKTKGLFAINEGALYPLLHSLERRGLVRARREEVRGRGRRYYGITTKGRRELRLARGEWSLLVKSVDALLR
jgi:DNA-binding PadR family transcriptional regulator